MPKDEQHDVIEQRSLSGTIIQGVAASGALAYGTGHLVESVAKLKNSFATESSAREPPTEKQD